MPYQSGQQVGIRRVDGDCFGVGRGNVVRAVHAGRHVADCGGTENRANPGHHGRSGFGQRNGLPPEGLTRCDRQQIGAQGVDLGHQLGSTRAGDAEDRHHGGHAQCHTCRREHRSGWPAPKPQNGQRPDVGSAQVALKIMCLKMRLPPLPRPHGAALSCSIAPSRKLILLGMTSAISRLCVTTTIVVSRSCSSCSRARMS